MDAKLHDYSEGAVTAGWYDGNTLVMEATFVYGSPYIFFEVYSGQPQIKTWPDATSGQRGIWHEGGNSLGVWTAIAGGRNNFLVVGDAGTTFSDTESAVVTITRRITHLPWLGLPTSLLQHDRVLRTMRVTSCEM